MSTMPKTSSCILPEPPIEARTVVQDSVVEFTAVQYQGGFLRFHSQLLKNLDKLVPGFRSHWGHMYLTNGGAYLRPSRDGYVRVLARCRDDDDGDVVVADPDESTVHDGFYMSLDAFGITLTLVTALELSTIDQHAWIRALGCQLQQFAAEHDECCRIYSAVLHFLKHRMPS